MKKKYMMIGAGILGVIILFTAIYMKTTAPYQASINDNVISFIYKDGYENKKKSSTKQMYGQSWNWINKKGEEIEIFISSKKESFFIEETANEFMKSNPEDEATPYSYKNYKGYTFEKETSISETESKYASGFTLYSKENDTWIVMNVVSKSKQPNIFLIKHTLEVDE